MMQKIQKNKNLSHSTSVNGFTIIELVVVMAIIGILVALSSSSFRSSQIKARDAQRKSDLKQISHALESYYNDYGQYPENDLDNKIEGCDGDTNVDPAVPPTACEWGETWADDNGTVYMIELPADPKSSSLNYYYDSSDGTYFKLYARLENERDSDIPTDVGGDPTDYGMACDGAGTYKCNYGIASSNESVD